MSRNQQRHRSATRRSIAAALTLVQALVVSGCGLTGKIIPPPGLPSTNATASHLVLEPPHVAAKAPPAIVDPSPAAVDTLAAPEPLPGPLPDPLPPPRAERDFDEEPLGNLVRNTTPVSLASILELAQQQNPQINVARERVVEAFAQHERSEIFWLPSIRAGVNYNKHEGRIQDVVGNIVETSRGAFYTGLGAGAVGAGSPSAPGVYANFHLTDALFQPKIVSQVVGAREAASQAVLNDTLLQVAQGYLELLRAEQEHAIATELYTKAKQLADITADYARTGQGPVADDDRAQVELSIRTNDLQRSEEAIQVASARLSQLLSTDPTLRLRPQEPSVAPIQLVDLNVPIQEFVAAGLSSRPEVSESGFLVCEAVERLRRERFAPLLPSVLLGVSYGGMGGGLGGDLNHFGDRFDADAIAYWEVRNLGLGERAIRKEARSRIGQARGRQIAVLDQISREVVEAHAQAQSRQKLIPVARQAIRVAEESYARNIARIENAQGLPIEALQSVQALGQARREYLRSVTDYNLAQFALHRALGWQDPGFLTE